MVPGTIKSSFKAAGVYPLNRRAIKIPGEVPEVTNTPTAVVAKREGIRYMPFLSYGLGSVLRVKDGRVAGYAGTVKG